MTSTKTCKECKKTFPKTREFFYSNGANKLRPRCKKCRSDYEKKMRKEGKIKKLDRTEYCRKRYAENKPMLKKINRRTYLRRKIKQGTIKDFEKVELTELVEELKNWK